jgi:hypothetical protein
VAARRALDERPETRRDARGPQPRRGPLILLGAIAAALVLALVVVVLGGGGEEEQ